MNGREVNQHNTYQVSWGFVYNNHINYVDDNYLYSRIRKIHHRTELNTVYNLEVENSHTYCVNNVAVHNCQDFSLAGKQAGGDEGSGTRSSLMYETIRIVKKLKPKYVIWENVKNLVSDKHSHNFIKYLDSMDDLNYNNYYQVLNAKDYGIPQNRERVFTVSIRKDIDQSNFYFPEPVPLKIRLKDLLENDVPEKYYLSDDKLSAISSWKAYQKPLENVLGNNSISPTLTARGAGEEHAGMITYSEDFENTTNVQNVISNTPNSKVISHNIPQTVKTRTYDVDIEELVTCLKDAKQLKGFSNKDIANHLNIPVTQVEHYFRTDNSNAIPSSEIWKDLKVYLGISTDKFDKSITTFEEKMSSYDMSNRVYDSNGIAPTIKTTEDRIIEYKGKDVELPAICASRGRDPENHNNRESGVKLKQTIEINTDGVSNTLTTVSKDNYVLENNTKLQYIGSVGDKDIVGDGKQLSRNSSMKSRVYDSDGIACTLSTDDCSGLYAVDKDIDNPLKGISGQSWQFEQNVYSENSKCVRTIKSGEGSGNIPKVIETNTCDSSDITQEIQKNKKEQLCDYMIKNNLVEPYDVINHGYTDYRFKSLENNNDIIMGKNLSPTITTRPDELGVTVTPTPIQKHYNLRIRKLTPKECWRLMGFDDEDFDKAEKVNSNAQLYKQAGNSIVVNVLEAILNSLFKPNANLPKHVKLNKLF